MRVSLAGLTALGDLGWSGTCAAPQLDGSMDDANAWSSACYPATAGNASLLYGAEGEAVPASVANAIANPAASIAAAAAQSSGSSAPESNQPHQMTGGPLSTLFSAFENAAATVPAGNVVVGVPAGGQQVPNVYFQTNPAYSNPTYPNDGYVPSYLDTVSASNAVAAPVDSGATPSNSTLLVIAGVAVGAYLLFGRH